MSIKKKTLSCAITSAIGVAGSVQAADIQFMTIEDINGDGVSGAFAFAPPGSTAYTHFFDSTSSVTFTPFIAPVTISPSNVMGITANGTGEGTATFTAGFLFAGGPFLPASLNGIGTGTNTTTPDGIDGSVSDDVFSLSMSQFHWGGQFGPNYFPMSPTGGVFTLNSAQQSSAQCALGSTNVCYQLRWEAFITPQAGLSGDTIWQIEGVAKLDTAVSMILPIPAATWLFGSGLLGLIGIARRRNYK